MSILFDERTAEWESQARFDDAVDELIENTRKEAWEETKSKIAKNCLKLNFSATDIANATGLTLAEVETLRNA
ncbi:MAG: hypothetical protein FWG68_02555 [Defluviitaleaceae bacterium]|nr:hypothetical protein [Defluviitaleaceae bacterium]